MRRHLRHLLIAALVSGGAAARATGQAADTARTDTTAIPLAPIRVTVLRTPLLLEETPFPVTVERVESTGPGLTLAEALGRVPGLQVDNRYNFSQGDRISVRGLGARAQFGVRGVKVLVDGIPATLPDGQTSLSHVDPRAIERAEVVRGPASSLWGNAAGGVIQLATGDAPRSGLAASATALAGAHGLAHYGAEAGWGSPSGRAASTGEGDPAGSGARGWSARASVSRLVYDGFRAFASADKQFGTARAEWRGGRDAVRVVAHGVAYEAENPGSLSAELLADDPRQAYPFNVQQATGERAEQAQLGLTWVRTGVGPEGGTLEVTAWALARDLDNPIPPVIIDLGRVAAGVRATARGGLTVAGRRVDWVAGVDAEGQWDDRLNFENDGGERGTLVLDQRETVTTVAPFTELSFPVAGPIEALAGLRWDVHEFSARDRIVVAGDPSTDASGSRVMDRWSPSLGLVATLGRTSVYGSVASSFETPTTTELVNRPGGGQGFNPSLEPQRAWSLEAGARARLGGRARVQLAGYRMTIDDALIPFEDSTAPGRTFFRNAGSAVHRGMEADARVDLGLGLVARLGYAWVDARFDRFITADADVSGRRVPGVAPHRVTGTLSWSRGGARAALEGRWVDAIPVTDTNDAHAPSYTVLDLRGVAPPLRLVGARLELFGGVDNLLDTAYVASVVVNAFGGRYYEPGPGRTAYLGVRVEP